MSHATLEIGLYRWGPENYALDLRHSRSGSEVEARTEQIIRPLADFDRKRFLPHLLDPRAYGRLLWACLFGDPRARDLLVRARGVAQELEVPLRLRLCVGPEMPYLHDLRWETLCDPDDPLAAPLFTREDILFSRYLISGDIRPVRPRPRAELRALVVIANPSNLNKYRIGDVELAPIDVKEQMQLAEAGLGDIAVTALVTLDAPQGQATVENILDRLREPDGFDILYLVCHGALIRGEPRLWLEDEDKTAEVVAGTELAARIRELTNRPRLAILMSCQSAGTGDDARLGSQGALTALGPQLADAGIAAVIASQGNLTYPTQKELVSTFFRELLRDGQIDRALAVARGAVRDRPDAWMPVLFMRLNSGCLWLDQDLVAAEPRLEDFSGWDGLLGYLDAGLCTPILGPGMNDALFGSHAEIARRWADSFRFPMAPFQRQDLPQVAQYLAVSHGAAFPRAELTAYLHRELLRRFQPDIPDLPKAGKLPDLMAHVGRWLRQQSEIEPHRLLASLGCPIYITTNPDSLLCDALREAGREPVEGLFNWRGGAPPPGAAFPRGYTPDAQHPLVYHLFGTVAQQRLLVLTQDDYFEYLSGAVLTRQNEDAIPGAVREALSERALLFIGFRLEDWVCRVLLQSIKNGSGRSLLEDYEHVAVQLDPQEGQIQDPEMARRYLAKMGLFKGTNVNIYWGDAPSFLRELNHRWAARQQPVGAV